MSSTLPARATASSIRTPSPEWAVYLRTSSDENQKPELSRARQRFVKEENVIKRSSLPVIAEYVDVLTWKTPFREGYQHRPGLAEQKDILRQLVERIVIDTEGKMRVELRSPFAYLHQLSQDVTGLVPESSGTGKHALQRKSARVNAPCTRDLFEKSPIAQVLRIKRIRRL